MQDRRSCHSCMRCSSSSLIPAWLGTGLDDIAEGFEFWSQRGLAPFELKHFGGSEGDTLQFEASESGLVIDGIASPHRIDRDNDIEAESEEVDGGLENADVGFNSAEDEGSAG